jgi:endoglucanase
LMDLKLPEDDRHIIATFHYYLPFEFTHQGAEWVAGSEAWLGREWKGNGSEKASISFNLDRVTQWSKDNNRPVWLGEFGAYSKADMDSRVRWTSYLARDAEKHQINWAYWEFGAGFGVYDLPQNTWRQPLLEALVP